MKFDLTIEASTIINDVSTIDNIGQFSIAIGNLIKGDSGKSPYIDETTKTWWEYNDTTKEYEDTGIAAKSVDIYNITDEIPLGAESFYNLSTAITATPVANRKKGLLLMFESADGIIEAYQFKSIVANWTNQSYWEIVFKTGTYGSNLVSNFDTISKSGWYTGYSGTIGQPYNSGTSWFILHENSAVGIASAYQIAVAFSTTMIMWFRIKQASVWGAWENISPSLKQDKTAVSLYNITNEIPLPAGSYYTLATAIAAIPITIRKLGLKITFQVSATNTETWEFFNGTIGNITNVAYWRKTDLDLKVDKTAIKQALGTSSTDVMSQKAVTDSILKAHDYDVSIYAYGISRDLNGTGQTLNRIGNLSLHKTRPITRKVRGCVKNALGINYYLHNDTDLLKEDGITPSVLDGTDGDVMTEIGGFYCREYTEGNIEYTYISEFPLPEFVYIPKTYHGRYEGSYNTITNQLRSVINSNIRGGLPATGQSVFYYNSGAIKDRNLDWSPDRLLSHYVRELLFRVHYATYNSQATFNSALTAEGYLQGGLGAGVTTLDGRWEWNGYNPFIPCGYTAELGNRTGVKNFTMPYAYDAQNTTTHINWYKGIYNVATIYNIGEYVADMEDTSIGLGNGKLYKCIQQTTAGIPLTDTAYFTLQTRTFIQTNRFIGIEQPFGHTFKQTIDAIIELTDNYTTTKCYVYDNPAHFAPTKTANARFVCNMPSAEGYIKLFNNYTIVPYSIGGSSGAWGYDYYYWRGEAGGALRGLLFGGRALNGSASGLGFSYSLYSPAVANADIGVRLCNFPEGSNIE